ncbi:MAG: alanine racemase [Comamonas sp.]|jgi:alanine racemase|nr:alanine racemase [Comamonas sp.]
MHHPPLKTPFQLLQHLPQLRHSQPDAQCWSVLPAGLPVPALEKIFATLRATDGIALHDPAHAAQLRRLDWRGPLLLPQGVAEPRALELCSRLGLWHVVHCDAQIDWLAAHKSQLPQHIWLPLAGAGQPGFALERLRSAYARLSALPQVEAITLVLHDRADLPAFVRASADLAGEQVLCQPLPADLHTLPSTPLPATLTQVWYASVQDDASAAGATTF